MAPPSGWPGGPLNYGSGPNQRLARSCMGSTCNAAQDRRRRASGWNRGVAHDRRRPPVGSCLKPEWGRAGPRPSLLPLRGEVEPSGGVPRGARAALPVVPRRQPGRHGRAPRTHRQDHSRDRTGAARTPCSPLPEMPHDVVAPTCRHLCGGRSRRPPRVSWLPTARSAPGVPPTRLTLARTPGSSAPHGAADRGRDASGRGRSSQEET